jgi:hypothetical protein
LAQNIISALRAVASNVTERPNGLLTDVGLGTVEELNKNGHGTGLDHHLGLRRGARGDVGKGPSSFELDKGMGRPEELDETAHDTSLNDLFDGRVSLFAKQFPELCCGLNLKVNLL